MNDFISTPWLIPAIYNVADMAIVSSMVLFMILTIRGVGLDGTRQVREPKRDEGTADAAGTVTGTPPPTELRGTQRPAAGA